MLGDYLGSFADRDWQTETVSDPVRFALVGVGWWTTEHALPAIEASDACEATVLVTGHPESAAAVAADSPSVVETLTYDEFAAGAATDAYDAAYVCTPNSLHPEHTAAAAENGKAVVCEKPMAATVEGAERMVETCADADVPLMVAYRMQTEPAVRRMHELLREGTIGDPVSVLGQMSDDILELIPDPDQWRLDPDLSGGTTVNDIGVYPLNTTRFLLDEDPVAVYASTRADSAEFEGRDEHAAFQVEFPSVTASCTVSHRATDASRLVVVGTAGQLVLEPAFFPTRARELTVEVGETRAHVTFDQVNQMREEFDYFAHCLRTGRSPHPDGDHGLVDMRAIAALYESAERGERVEVGGDD